MTSANTGLAILINFDVILSVEIIVYYTDVSIYYFLLFSMLTYKHIITRLGVYETV